MNFIGVVILLSSVFGTIQCEQCDPNSGPPGKDVCWKAVYMNYYGNGGYQWGVCLSDTYIQQKSKGRYLCQDRSRTYCIYQCMLEQYEMLSGRITDTCACNPGENITNDLPAWCYSPSGDNCNWYRQCLEKKHPCEGSTDPYAITFAEKFCKLYSENYEKFSDIGRRWVDAVRKCLQVALVPLIRQFVHPTCEKIKETAFHSHDDCYVNPYQGAPSICDIQVTDWLKVLLTIKSSFITASYYRSLKSLFTVGGSCIGYWSHSVSGFIKLKFNAVFEKMRQWRGKRALQDFNATRTDDYDVIAGHVFDGLAIRLKFDKKGMGWFSYAGNTSSDGGKIRMTINAVLLDKSMYDMNHNATNNSDDIISGRGNVDLNKTVNDIADVIRTEGLHMNVDGYEVNVSELHACSDMTCNQTIVRSVTDVVRTTRTTLTPDKNHGAKLTPFSSLILAVAMWVYMMS